jgi:hypothetical protein
MLRLTIKRHKLNRGCCNRWVDSRAGSARANRHHRGRHPGANNCIAAVRPVRLLVARLWETQHVSARCISPVNDQLRSGHKLGFVAGQIYGTPGNVVRLAHVPRRMQCTNGLARGRKIG